MDMSILNKTKNLIKTYEETYLKTESDDQESSVVIMGR